MILLLSPNSDWEQKRFMKRCKSSIANIANSPKIWPTWPFTLLWNSTIHSFLFLKSMFIFFFLYLKTTILKGLKNFPWLASFSIDLWIWQCSTRRFFTLQASGRLQPYQLPGTWLVIFLLLFLYFSVLSNFFASL